MEINYRRTNHNVAEILHRTLDHLASTSDLEIKVGLVPCSDIEGLAIKNGRSVFNRFRKNYGWQPQVGHPLFEEYLMNVAKKGTPITVDPISGIVQAEIKKKALRGQEFPLTEGIWYQVADGQLNLYRNRERITHDDLY